MQHGKAKKTQAAKADTKRSLILATALKLFVEQGYSNVSMDALAHAVPVSKPTLYNHFEDKKALFTAVMQNRCMLIAEEIQQILFKENKNIEATLTEMGKRFLKIVLSPQAIGIYRTAIMEVPHFPKIGELFYKSGPLRSKEIFAAYLERLHKQGKLHIPNAMRAAEVFFGMMIGRMQVPLLLGVKQKISARDINGHIKYVVGVFLRGQKPGHME